MALCGFLGSWVGFCSVLGFFSFACSLGVFHFVYCMCTLDRIFFFFNKIWLTYKKKNAQTSLGNQ
jgi:hypothetical protein